ncbi:unnamed protein product, partial [Ectocarpus fasciculatus]
MHRSPRITEPLAGPHQACPYLMASRVLYFFSALSASVGPLVIVRTLEGTERTPFFYVKTITTTTLQYAGFVSLSHAAKPLQPTHQQREVRTFTADSSCRHLSHTFTRCHPPIFCIEQTRTPCATPLLPIHTKSIETSSSISYLRSLREPRPSPSRSARSSYRGHGGAYRGGLPPRPPAPPRSVLLAS